MSRAERRPPRGSRGRAPATPLRIALSLLAVVAALGAGAVAVRQVSAVSWSLFGDLASPWNTVVHIVAQVGAIFAVAALVTLVKVPTRWLTLSAGGLLVAASLLALRAMHGGWEANIFVPGGRYHRGAWTTVSDVVPETLLVGAAMIAAGVVGFSRARRRARRLGEVATP